MAYSTFVVISILLILCSFALIVAALLTIRKVSKENDRRERVRDEMTKAFNDLNDLIADIENGAPLAVLQTKAITAKTLRNMKS